MTTDARNGGRHVGEPFSVRVPGNPNDIDAAIADLRDAAADYEERDGVRIALGTPAWVDADEILGAHWHATGNITEITER